MYVCVCVCMCVHVCVCVRACTHVHPQQCCDPIYLLIGKYSIFKNGFSANFIVEDQFEEDADSGLLRPFLAVFWDVMAPE